ncbi:DNA-binding protein [Nonomuraea sp. KC401]|uniref:DNA-binding protein n=1 Tax=unclassified Nonomuraea TaxID=2593643 RepID=UPI0010FD7C62|nr:MULTISPECIES: DNA-binding protein [unclassified Nonomuraea]NBF00480.1 DNA-binding protein [Nonomuraea sp. K271]TLF51690.1 DNA-binding protein [Nonomuraea sp. KC401]
MNIDTSRDRHRRHIAAHAARARLIDRFGTDEHRRQQAEFPTGPRVPATELLRLVLDASHGTDTGVPEVRQEDLTDALQMVVSIRRSIDSMEYNAIAAARKAGLTWRQLADALALESPQAAQQRFQRLGDRLNDTAIGENTRSRPTDGL